MSCHELQANKATGKKGKNARDKKDVRGKDGANPKNGKRSSTPPAQARAKGPGGNPSAKCLLADDPDIEYTEEQWTEHNANVAEGGMFWAGNNDQEDDYEE